MGIPGFRRMNVRSQNELVLLMAPAVIIVGTKMPGMVPGLGADEAFFGDPNDLVNVAAHAERASDHLRILSEAVRPIVVREHGVGMRARLEVVVLR